MNDILIGFVSAILLIVIIGLIGLSYSYNTTDYSAIRYIADNNDEVVVHLATKRHSGLGDTKHEILLEVYDRVIRVLGDIDVCNMREIILPAAHFSNEYAAIEEVRVTITGVNCEPETLTTE